MPAVTPVLENGSRSGAPSVWLIQISDTHLFEGKKASLCGVNTHQSLEEVLDSVREFRPQPDFYLATGDLSQDATPESYLHLKRQFRSLKKPVYCLPGNHDRPSVMSQILKKGPIRWTENAETGAWGFIFLNSTRPRSVEGYIRDSELKRLDRYLKRNSHRHVLIVLHHPPIKIGSRWMDRIKVSNASSFLRVLDRHANVRGVLFGHVHQESLKFRKHVVFMSGPSTCAQFKPQSSHMEIDRRLPGYRWIELRPDGALRTGVKRLNSSKCRPDYSIRRY